MTTSPEPDLNWDFSATIDLVRSFKASNIAASRSSRTGSPPLSNNLDTNSLREVDATRSCHLKNEQSPRILGNFNRLWKFLGGPKEDLPVLSPPWSGTQDRGFWELSPEDTAVTLKPSIPKNPSLSDLESRASTQYDCRNAEGRAKEEMSLAAWSRKQTFASKQVPEQSIVPDSLGNQRRSVIQNFTSSTPLRKQNHHMPVSDASLRDLSESELKKDHPKRQNTKPSRTGYLSDPDKRHVNANSSNDSALGTSAIRKRELVLLLHDRFKNDRKYLKRLGPSVSTPESSKAGIHVFVDLSNILIGFHDTLNATHGISSGHSALHRKSFSFHSLSLLLERGRPTAKRVVAGSDEVMQAKEARDLGYETNILERVLKTKKSRTPAQRLQKDEHVSHSPQSADSAIPGRFERKVEQGVDEILHLKIAQSFLDVALPATIVLASGDAAAAEYSDGFLKMLERGLQRGWKVELVAFKANVSAAYRAKAWKKRWGSQFQIIEMDDYADLLHAA